MAKTMRLTATLIKQYQQLFASCSVLPQHRASVERLTAQLLQQQARYQAVADKTRKNEAKYPADKVRGSSRKYTEY